MKIWGIVGWKNTGKTNLVMRLVTEFRARGLTVSTIKHAHHGADLDRRGTDSFGHREAGAAEVILATPARVAILQELRGAPEPTLDDLVARLLPVDLVLVEGFKAAGHPKIETHRAAVGERLIAETRASVRAIASDAQPVTDRPVLPLDDTAAIADFIATDLGL